MVGAQYLILGMDGMKNIKLPENIFVFVGHKILNYHGIYGTF